MVQIALPPGVAHTNVAENWDIPISFEQPANIFNAFTKTAVWSPPHITPTTSDLVDLAIFKGFRATYMFPNRILGSFPPGIQTNITEYMESNQQFIFGEGGELKEEIVFEDLN